MSSLVIGTAGHIDHGKSALVKALTGTDPDRLKEEQVRGITIDLGFAHARIGGADVAFVDVPGHERFIRNMLAGAGGIDAVLLVVAADESVMPQTREHFHICRLLGLERGVIALSKSDLADGEMRTVAADEVRALVSGSFLADAPVVTVSSRTGEGLDALRAALAGLAGHQPRQAREGVVRLPIDRVFTVKGFGPVVTGTLVSGAVSVGDELVVLPESRAVRVRGLQVHGRPETRAAAPSRLAANLSGVEAGALARGQTLATPGALSVSRRVDLRLQLLADAPALAHGRRVRVHHGTTDVPGRVAIAATRSGRGGDWVPSRIGALGVSVPPGGDAFVRVRVTQPMVLTRGDRVVIRSYSPAATIGGGVVLDPEPPASGLRRPSALERFVRLDDASPQTAFDLFLEEAGGRGLELAALVRRAGLGAREAEAFRAEAVASGRAVTAGSRVFSAGALARTGDDIERAISAFHSSRPLESGIPRETLRATLSGQIAAELIDLALERLVASGTITGTDRLALATHSPRVPPEDARIRDSILSQLRAAGLTPPDLETLASAAGAGRTVVDRVASALVREKAIVRLDQLLFHPEALARLKADVRERRQQSGAATVDVGMFKQQYGLSRKYAIPLLEWLDRERVTRRSGDTRIVL